MAEVQSIHPADLRQIENSLNAIHQNMDVLNRNIDTVDQNVRVVYDELGALARDFRDYVEVAERQHNLSVAETRLVKLRQELETKFGHYSEVRRTTTGILQADDLGIVKKDTISNVTEELMLTTPNYWLTPCLIALAAWINDQQELADRAVREAIKRNDEKTSLLFALVCRRADRKNACLKWTQRYLANQDEENLDRKAIIILDAFASGLLGNDTEGVVARQMDEWISNLSDKPGFVEKQTAQWSEAINLKREPLGETDYTYLKKYSKTWPVLEDIMEGANLHAILFSYFETIFNQEATTATLKRQLDDILDSLVTDFDDEELPLRMEEKKNQFIVEFKGDLKRAEASMDVEKTAFETHKDFTQLLTDAAMKPESSHASVSTQKFAIALSKEWITNAYNDVVANNRVKIPHEIQINVDTFNDKTTDGQNEAELISKFDALVTQEKNQALSQLVMSSFDQFCLYGGGVIAAVGLIMLIMGNVLLGIIAAVAGLGLVFRHFSRKKELETKRQNIETQYEQKRTNGKQIIRATLAEVVDFRLAFEEKDKESQKVTDFLEQITPEQYMRKMSETSRRIRTAD